MPFTKDNVGQKMVDGVAVKLSDAEAIALAAEWNSNEAEMVAAEAIRANNDARTDALAAKVKNRTVSAPELAEYIDLKGI